MPPSRTSRPSVQSPSRAFNAGPVQSAMTFAFFVNDNAVLPEKPGLASQPDAPRWKNTISNEDFPGSLAEKIWTSAQASSPDSWTSSKTGDDRSSGWCKRCHSRAARARPSRAITEAAERSSREARPSSEGFRKAASIASAATRAVASGSGGVAARSFSGKVATMSASTFSSSSSLSCGMLFGAGRSRSCGKRIRHMPAWDRTKGRWIARGRGRISKSPAGSSATTLTSPSSPSSSVITIARKASGAASSRHPGWSISGLRITRARAWKVSSHSEGRGVSKPPSKASTPGRLRALSAARKSAASLSGFASWSSSGLWSLRISSNSSAKASSFSRTSCSLRA